MTLLASRLETAIKDPLKAELESEISALFSISPDNPQNDWFHKFCQAVAYSCAKIVAEKVIEEITGFARVNSGIALSVTSGPGAGSTGDTTGTGTIS